MWNEWWSRYKGRVIGIAGGLLLGVVYLRFGFWDMLIFAFITAVCGYAGSRFDGGGLRWNADEWLGRLSKMADRWRWFR